MSDFKNYSSSLSGPLKYATPVVPDDNTDLLQNSRCLYVGGAGNITVLMAGDQGAASPVTFQNVSSGLLPIMVSRILQTGTTATDIVAGW